VQSQHADKDSGTYLLAVPDNSMAPTMLRDHHVLVLDSVVRVAICGVHEIGRPVHIPADYIKGIAK
jgi:hypothetical protein